MKKETISFTIPCYRSEKTVQYVINEIENIMSSSSDYEYEIIACVDGSPDNVFDVLSLQAEKNNRIKVVAFSKNFGQAHARIASLRYSSGDYVVCLDDDGQCPVDKIFDLLEPLKKGFDVSIADYPIQKQSAFKNFGSRVNNITTRFLLDVPSNFRLTNFYVMKRFVAKQITTYRNPYPFMDGLLSQATKRIAYVKMEERERIEGKTGYTFRKLFSLWLNGFTAFSVKPLRVSSLVGVLCAIVGFAYGIVTIIRKITLPNINVGWSSIVSIMLFMGGLIMLMLGMIGEYIGRIYISINNAPQYVVRDTINIDDNENENDNK